MSTETRAKTSALWAPERRNFTIGLILIITLAAFEAMGLGTALPTIVTELDGHRYYSWPFTVFMAASAIGTVLGGRLADRRGPAVPLLLALPTFALGLVVAGVAQDMPTLLVARVLQGLGGGTQIVALYVMIARAYPEEHRPKAFGAISSAWVVPALVGPAIAGFLTEYLSWRWVFLGLAPLVLLGAVLLAPTVRRFGAGAEEGTAPRRKGLPLAAFGASAGVVALTWSAQNPSLFSLVLGVAAVVALGTSIRVLVPAGTLLARPGLPVMVLARGLMAGVFFTAQAFVPLTLSAVHHYSPTMAGVPLTVGSLGWSVGALWQGGQRALSREAVVATGLVLVGAGVAGLTLIAPEWGPHWLVFGLWFVAGSGMGLGMASTSVRVLELSPADERGFNSSALQLSDMLGQAAMVGLGGVLVTSLAASGSPAAGVVPLDLLLTAAACCAAPLVLRSRREQMA
ncbi:MFS transporter [Saccharopolyspora erythraea]|uniref:MFS transporter n=1 Tax=Saccharopolyspora erythraea TaxID=1836 RepID=UPI001BAB0C29|nr:MFS transporter [Saccharopolyspora erythraea]QUH04617.1 MFS transporter [Saccharopolyspora erythraea]